MFVFGQKITALYNNLTKGKYIYSVISITEFIKRLKIEFKELNIKYTTVQKRNRTTGNTTVCKPFLVFFFSFTYI